MTIEYVYKDKRNGAYYYVTVESFDTSGEELDITVLDDHGEEVTLTEDMEEMARDKVLDRMSEIEYTPYE